MAMAGRLRSGFPILRRTLNAENLSFSAAAGQRSTVPEQFSRNYAAASPAKEKKIRVPVTMFGATGNYASALYIAAVKANVLDRVESELITLVEASKKSPKFSQFMRDPTVTKDNRIKALTDICVEAKFDDITKNFLAVVAELGRLGLLQRMTERFSELTMAHRGEVKATVITVIPLPAEEEKELKDTLQEVLGQGKKVIVEQKVDPSILGGLVVQFGQKVFDMSIRTRARQMERFLREPINADPQ